MNEEYGLAGDEVNSILFSDEFLAEQLDELRNEIIRSRETGKTLERIA